MELNENIIKTQLAKKGIPAYKMCEDIKYSQASLNHFYRTGEIRTQNREKILKYLELDNQNLSNSKVILKEDNRSDSVSDSFIDRLLMKIENQAIEIFTLKRELGKFSSTCLALSA